jgi:hypothetical protein
MKSSAAKSGFTVQQEEREEEDCESSSEVASMLEATLKKLKEKEKKDQEKKMKKTGSRQSLPSVASSEASLNLGVGVEHEDSKSLVATVRQLAEQVSALQSQNTLLCRDLTSLH